MDNKIHKGNDLFKMIFCSLLFLSLISLISATPPFQSSTSTSGFDIKFPQFDNYPANQSISFNFHLYNISNGVPINSSTATCFLHLSNITGQFLNVSVPPETDSNVINEYNVIISGGNFSNLGDYGYTFQCNSSTLGGFVSNPFQITPFGSNGNISISLPMMIVLMIICYGMGIYGFFIWRNKWFSMTGGIMMIFLGLFIIKYGIDIYLNSLTNLIAIITLVIGAIFMLIPIGEDLEQNLNWFDNR